MARVWRFGDDVNTDVITPGRFNVTTDDAELAGIPFCEVRPEFADEVQEGDVVVAGRNFGCGSSRESAPRALQAAGVAAVVATGFARIFYRNSVNIGLPVLTSPDAHDLLDDGDEVTLDLEEGRLAGPDGEATLEAPDGIPARIARAGGVFDYLDGRDEL